MKYLNNVTDESERHDLIQIVDNFRKNMPNLNKNNLDSL